MRIIIADDHAVTRAGVKLILSTHFPNIETAEAAGPEEIFRHLAAKSWHLVLLDLNFGGRGGFDTLKNIKSSYAKLPVLILSMYSEEHFGVRAIKLGAAGYLNKGTSTDTIVNAVREVLSGGTFVSAELAELIYSVFRNGITSHEKLSVREFEVLRLIASGKSVKEIAMKFCLSGKTVSTHKARIQEKLNLHTNSDLVEYARVNDLVD